MNKSKIYQLSSNTLANEIEKDFKNKGGVYKMFCKVNGEIQPICRLLDTDKDGILYIGSTKKYLNRIIDLKKTINQEYKSTSHIGGRRYNKNINTPKVFPYPNLYVQLIGHESPDDFETEHVNEYFKLFGEVPPLNANNK